MGSVVPFTAPSGAQYTLPRVPNTYVDEVPAPSATPSLGSRVGGLGLEEDITCAIAWLGSRPFFVGYQTGTQSIANQTWTPIALDSEQIDSYAGHTDQTNTGRYYFPLSGNIGASYPDYYLATGVVKWSSSAPTGKDLIAGMRLTGGTTVEGCKIGGASGHNVGAFAADLIQAGNNDYVELMGWQESGAALSTAASAGSLSSLQVRWVGSNRLATQPLPGTPHVWANNDQITATATGASPAGGVKVPLMTELNSHLAYLYNPPLAKLVTTSTTQTIASSSTAWTSYQWTAASIDNYGGWSSGANTKYTVQRAGMYHLIGFASLTGVSAQAGYVASRFSINGGSRFIPGMAIPPANNTTTGTRVAAIVHDRFNAGDTIELQVQQNSGSTLGIGGLNDGSKLLVIWEAL